GVDDLLAGQGGVPGPGGGVHGEHDGGRAAGAVVLGDRADGRGAVLAGLEVGGRGVEQLLVEREAAVPVLLDVHVDVDRVQGGKVHLSSPQPSPCSSLTASRARSAASRRAASSARSVPASSAATPSTIFVVSSGVSDGSPMVRHHSSVGGPRCSSTWAMPPGPPDRSCTANGPSSAQRRPGPLAIAVSMSATDTTPRSTSEYASRHNAACRRLATCPGSSWRSRIGFLPSAV